MYVVLFTLLEARFAETREKRDREAIASHINDVEPSEFNSLPMYIALNANTSLYIIPNASYCLSTPKKGYLERIRIAPWNVLRRSAHSKKFRAR